MMPQTADFIFSILHALDDSSASTIHKEWKEEFCEMTMSIVHSLSTSYGISRFLSPSRDPGVSRPARPLRSPLPRSSFTCIASSACSAPSPSPGRRRRSQCRTGSFRTFGSSPCSAAKTAPRSPRCTTP